MKKQERLITNKFVFCALFSTLSLSAMDKPAATSALAKWSSYKTIALNHKKEISSLDFTQSEKLALMVGTDDYIQAWDIENEKTSFDLECPCVIRDVKLDEKNSRLFGVGPTGTRICFNTQDKTMIYQREGIDKFYTDSIKWNSNLSKVIMQDVSQAIVIDTSTGNIESTLWSGLDSADKYFIFADFDDETRSINVFHDGCASDYKDNGNIRYLEVLPKGTGASFYSCSQKSVLYFDQKECDGDVCIPRPNKVGVYDLVEKTTNTFDLKSQSDSGYYNRHEIQLLGKGSILQIYSIGLATAHNRLDFYRLKRGKKLSPSLTTSLLLNCILSMKPDLFVSCYNEKQKLLALGLKDGAFLYRVNNGQAQHIATLSDGQGKSVSLVTMNEQGDKIIVRKKEEAIILREENEETQKLDEK